MQLTKMAENWLQRVSDRLHLQFIGCMHINHLIFEVKRAADNGGRADSLTFYPCFFFSHYSYLSLDFGYNYKLIIFILLFILFCLQSIKANYSITSLQLCGMPPFGSILFSVDKQSLKPHIGLRFLIKPLRFVRTCVTGAHVIALIIGKSDFDR